MASFKISPVVDPSQVQSCLLGADTVANGGGLVDADIGKPVKLVATDRYAICADGDPIDGFLASIEPSTVGGYTFGTIRKGPFVKVELDGDSAIGTYVAAADPAANGTAEANGLPKVSVHTPAAADAAKWRVVSGTGLDTDTTAVVERA